MDKGTDGWTQLEYKVSKLMFRNMKAKCLNTILAMSITFKELLNLH